jgi:hypothetical protein
MSANLDKPAMPHVSSYFDGGEPNEISPGLTAREHACIQLRVPKSGDPELDALIREAVRRDLAGKAMQGMLSSHYPAVTSEHHSIWAVAAADALLAALETAP